MKIKLSFVSILFVFTTGNFVSANANNSLASAPSGITVGSITTTSILLSWNTVSGAVSYNVYKCVLPDGSYTLLISGITSTSYTDTTGTIGVNYYYKVSAVSSGGESDLSNSVAAKLLTATYTPLHTYYVATTGLDTNDGSSDHPFLTIAKALTVVVPGSDIIVRPGSYGRTSVSVSGKRGLPIRIKAETNVQVQHVANGTKVHSDESWNYTYQDFTYSTKNAVQVTTCKGFEIGQGKATSYIEIEGFEITNIGQSDNILNGIRLGRWESDPYVSNINIKNNFIHNLECYLGCTDGICGYGNYITVSGNTLWQVEGVSICLYALSNYGVIENNDLSHGIAMRMSDKTAVCGDADATRVWGANHIIRNNFIHDYVFNESEPYAEPHCDGTQSFYDDAYFSGSGIAGWPLNNLLVEGNFIYNIGQIFMCSCNIAGKISDLTFRNNIFAVTQAIGILDYGLYYVKAYNNIFYKTRFEGICFNVQKGNYAKYGEVINNIFVNSNVVTYYSNETLPTFNVNYNLYTKAYMPGTTVPAGANETYGYDISTTPLFVDPDNIDPYARNFHYLSSASALMNNGTTISSFSTDKDGNTRSGSWDLGCYEYKPTAVNVLQTNSLKIYPNPVTDNLTIEFSMINEEDVEVSLLDATGKSVKVITNRQFQQGKNTISLDMTDLPACLYFIQLKTDKNLTTQKIIKQ
jgi:hypothetical protein